MSETMTSRRHLLSRSAALSAAGVLAGCLPPTPAPATASGADAELLRLCAAFQDRHRLLLHLEREEDFPDEQFTAVNDEWWAIFQRIVDTPARTPDGLAAKGAMLKPVMRNTCGLQELEPRDHLALSLAADLTGRA